MIDLGGRPAPGFVFENERSWQTTPPISRRTLAYVLRTVSFCVTLGGIK